jgi:diacylglycerol kinase family enzyme
MHSPFGGQRLGRLSPGPNLKLFVVINPHAKRNKKLPELPEKLEKILGPSAVVRLSQSLDGVESVAREALAAGCEVLGICGGDGTIHHTVSRFLKVYGSHPLPKILTLGGGTMNMVCHSVGVLGPSEGIARRYRAIVDEERKLPIVFRETIHIEERYSFIFGLGLVSNFLDAYYEGGDTGPVKAALVVQRAITSVMKRSEFAKELFAPWRGEVVVDGKTLPYAQYTAVLAQTIENLGIGFKPMYRAFEQPGTFHLIATQMNAVKLVNHLPDVFFGRPMHHPETYDTVAKGMILRPEKEILYTMDGDMYTTQGELTVGMGPTLEILKI